MLKRRSAGGNRRLDHRGASRGARKGIGEPARSRSWCPTIPGVTTDTAGRLRRREDELRFGRTAGDRRESWRRQHHHRQDWSPTQARRSHFAVGTTTLGDKKRRSDLNKNYDAKGLQADFDLATLPTSSPSQEVPVPHLRRVSTGEQADRARALRTRRARQISRIWGRMLRRPQQSKNGEHRLQRRGDTLREFWGPCAGDQSRYVLPHRQPTSPPAADGPRRRSPSASPLAQTFRRWQRSPEGHWKARCSTGGRRRPACRVPLSERMNTLCLE